MKYVSKKIILFAAVVRVSTFIIFLASFILPVFSVNAQTVNLDASKLVPHVQIGFSPSSGSFAEGSTFEVPIIIDTRGLNINSTEIRVNFDRDKLSIISSSNGVSIIGIWVEPPRYDNTRGTASYIGVITNGITTNSGVIGTITFKALKTGKASVSISSNSKVLLNDGLGTDTVLDLRRAEYSIVPKAPEGVPIFSETHPFQSSWYNNNSPVVSWEKVSGVEGFSFVLDNLPNTIPPSSVNITETTKAFDKLNDGLWYFHIKANKAGSWGTAGHFLMRIDTSPPAEFTPEVNYLLATSVLFDKALVSFFTTDNLSGIDHYEVGVIDKKQPTTESPIFVQSDSPFQVPVNKDQNIQVIVRAIDKAGNIRDSSMNVLPPSLTLKFIKDNLVYILLLIIALGIIFALLHFLFGHHIIRNMRRVFKMIHNEEEQEIAEQNISYPKEFSNIPPQTFTPNERYKSGPPKF